MWKQLDELSHSPKERSSRCKWRFHASDLVGRRSASFFARFLHLCSGRFKIPGLLPEIRCWHYSSPAGPGIGEALALDHSAKAFLLVSLRPIFRPSKLFQCSGLAPPALGLLLGFRRASDRPLQLSNFLRGPARRDPDRFCVNYRRLVSLA